MLIPDFEHAHAQSCKPMRWLIGGFPEKLTQDTFCPVHPKLVHTGLTGSLLLELGCVWSQEGSYWAATDQSDGGFV